MCNRRKPQKNIDDLINNYNSTPHKLTDKYVPLQCKTIPMRPHAPWYTSALRQEKRVHRRSERVAARTMLEVDRQIVQDMYRRRNEQLVEAKTSYFTKKVEESKDTPKDLLRFTLRNISRIRKYIPQDTSVVLVKSLVMSRLDYSNGLFYGLPQCTVSGLQAVQIFAARIITQERLRDHDSMSRALLGLHWLPVDKRIEYKLLLYTYKALHDRGIFVNWLCRMCHVEF